MTSSGTRTPARSTYDAWSSLDPDLLVIVAKNSDATSVCRLSQACKAWRGAVAANSSSIWEQLVAKRFSRSARILKALPPPPKFSFLKHYREQLKAESSSMQYRPLTVTTQLSEFIFTAELVSTSEPRRIIDAWTGNVDSLSLGGAGNGNFVLPIDWRPWSATWCRPHQWGVFRPNEDVAMRLELFVSRACKGQIRTRKVYASDIYPDDGDNYDGRLVYFFYNGEGPLPVTGRYQAKFIRDDVPNMEPVVHLDLDHPADELPTVLVQFRLDNEYASNDMTGQQLLEYLEHGVGWECECE